MPTLFKRDWQLRLDNLIIKGLDIAFDVEKTIRRTPNTCSLQVWNLNAEHRRHLEQLSVRKKRGPGKIRVEIEAGYVDARTLIFRGDLRRAATKRDGSDLVTTIEGDDGGQAIKWSRVNESFPPGTRVVDVLLSLTQAMGIGQGNLMEVAPLVTTFTNGTVVSGNAANELGEILASVGLTYSVQNGVLQVLRRGQGLQATAIRLSSSTGLVGTPEANADGTITVTSLLIPDLYPGRLVVLDSPSLSGGFHVTKCKYTGDTFADAWYIEMECKAYSR